MARPWGVALGLAFVLGAWHGLAAVVFLGFWALVQVGLLGRPDWTLVVASTLALVLGAVRSVDTPPGTAHGMVTGATQAVVHIESLPRPSGGGESVRATVVEVLDGDRWTRVEPVSVMLRMPDGHAPVPGERLRVTWSVSPLAELSPGYAQYLAAQGVALSGTVWHLEVMREGPAPYRWLVDLRRRITDGLMDALPGDAGALASGIVTGNDDAMSDDAREAFLRTGTTHITAVSGSNVAMLLALWNIAVPPGRARRRLAVQLLIVATVWGYATLVGLEPPAVRAALVATVGLFATRVGRRPDLVTLLVLSAALMVAWNPAHVRMVAFWLSFVASIALAVRIPTAPGRNPRQVARGVLEGVILAQAATLPLILAWFGTVSITSIAANALLAPLMWIAFPLCFLLAGLVVLMPAIASWLAVLALVPLAASLVVVQSLAQLAPPLMLGGTGPAAVIMVAVPCALVTLWWARDARRWLPRVHRVWREQPWRVEAALLAPAVAILLVLVSIAAGW